MDQQVKGNQYILGCLYGQAVGDAMGMPSELWSQPKVRDYFGEINSFLAGSKENVAASMYKVGQYTDDTQQALAIIHSLIECEGKIVPENIAQHLLRWVDDNHIFEQNILGPTSKVALSALKQGVPINSVPANGVTNGAAMRISPVGCLLTTKDRSRFIQCIADVCSVTHKSDIAITGAVVVAWAISRAIDRVDWQTIKSELIILALDVQSQFESTFSASLARRIQLAFDLVERLKGQSQQCVLTEIYQVIGAGVDMIETIPSALAIVDLTQQDPMICARYCANLGGDTDTIGAIATAICGAIKGIDAFPLVTIDTINTANHIDFTPLAKALTVLRLNKG